MGELTVPSDSSYDSSVHLSFGDVAVDDPSAPSILSIHLKASKTDRFRKGVDVFVGRTEQELCPVSAVLAFYWQSEVQSLAHYFSSRMVVFSQETD